VPYYPGPLQPAKPPYGIDRPPSEVGDGVDGYSSEDDYDDRPKYFSGHHTKYPSEYPTKFPAKDPTRQHPKSPSSKAMSVHGQRPQASVPPAKPQQLPDGESYHPYTNLAYPAAYPAAYPENLV
jgi:hypothetical protein